MKPTESPLFQLYIHELYWLADGIVRNCESIFAGAPAPPDGHYIKVAPELHATITAVLIDGANIKKLIATSPKKSKNENTRQYRFRQQRSKLLAQLVEGLQLTEILNAKVRNTLEHFDEYLDRECLRLQDADEPPAPMAAYNMTLSDSAVFDPMPLPIRVYLADARVFRNLEYAIDLAAIQTEARAIRERLSELLRPSVDGPGALMVPLGKRSSA